VVGGLKLGFDVSKVGLNEGMIGDVSEAGACDRVDGLVSII
jgi:hypothetical protein